MWDCSILLTQQQKMGSESFLSKDWLKPLILQYCDTQLFCDVSVAEVSGGDGSKHTQQQTRKLTDTQAHQQMTSAFVGLSWLTNKLFGLVPAKTGGQMLAVQVM